jgi:hypothetical protein
MTILQNTLCHLEYILYKYASHLQPEPQLRLFGIRKRLACLTSTAFVKGLFHSAASKRLLDVKPTEKGFLVYLSPACHAGTLIAA